MEKIIELQRDQNGKLITYVRFSRIYADEFKKLTEETNYLGKYLVIDCTPLSNLENFMNKVYDFEMTNNPKENRIFAISIDLLIPKNLTENHLKRKLIKHFMKCYVPEAKLKINYYAYSYTKGEGNYIRLIIFEREYLNKRKYERYKQNYYTYIKDDKGELISKKIRNKGDYKLNEKGKRIKTKVLFSDKLRLFNFSTKEQLKTKVGEVVDTAIKMLNVKIEEKKMLKFDKVTLFSSADRIRRRVIIAINQFKIKLEYHLNQYYTPLQQIVESIEASYDYKIARWNSINERERLASLIDIFNWLKQIFNDNRFFAPGERRINYNFVPLPELEKNISELFELFLERMKKFRQKFKFS